MFSVHLDKSKLAARVLDMLFLVDKMLGMKVELINSSLRYKFAE